MILFLDDAPLRTVLFSQRMSDENRGKTHWCRTAQEAIETIKLYGDVFSHMYLDHDLGDERGDFRSENSGMEVVRFLEKQKKSEFHKTKIVIHSWNIPAGRRMTARLQNAGYNAIHQPFGT